MAEIEKYLEDSGFLKERHIQKFDSMPNWIKRDAQFWVDGLYKDSHYGYGIRAMLENKVLSPPIIDNTKNRFCNEHGICLKENDFVKYSHVDKFGNVITEKFFIKSIDSQGILVDIERSTKEEIIHEQFYLDENSKIPTMTKCCKTKKFVYSVPLKDNLPDGFFIVGKSSYPVNDVFREGYIVQNQKSTETLLIDKQTGILLTKKTESNDIVKVWEKMSLIDTNVFQKSEGIKLDNMRIPKWWKTSTMWFLEGKFSETEYIHALEYLIGKNILRV